MPLLTWYDILDIMPGASADDVQRACAAKAAVLRPELVRGAPATVAAAAGRARACIEEARRVLLDPERRKGYDVEVGIVRPGGGLERPEPVPSERGPDPSLFTRGSALDTDAIVDVLGVLADWLAPRPAAPRRITVPDVCGLFAGPCRHLVVSLGLRPELIRLTEHPMPVEGLVVDQTPRPGTSVRRSSALTVRVWHPAKASPRS